MDKRLIDADKLLTDLKDKKKSLRESLNFAKREGETKWAEDLRECPWVEDAAEVGRFYETKIKGYETGYQLVWNYLYDMPDVTQ